MNVDNFRIDNNNDLVDFYYDYFPFVKTIHKYITTNKGGANKDLNEVIAYLQDFKYSDIHQKLPSIYKTLLEYGEPDFESTKSEYSQAYNFLREKNIKLNLLLKSMNTAYYQNEKIITNINHIENYIKYLYNAK